MKPKLPTNLQKLAYNVPLDADELFRSEEYFNKCVTKLTASNKAFAKPEAGSYKKAGNFNKLISIQKTPVPPRETPIWEEGQRKGEAILQKTQAVIASHEENVSADTGNNFDKHILQNEEDDFTAGRLHDKIAMWESITTDPVILHIIREGLEVDFALLPTSSPHRALSVFSSIEKLVIENEIIKQIFKKVIYPTGRCPGDFLSGIFTRPKLDGTHRMILSLKKLNEFVYYQHFKMESLTNVLNMIKPGAFMASVDLKDAFYSVPIHPEHQKYFKFFWNGNYYQFAAMPNGYGPAMTIFTKILKPPFSNLCTQGLLSVVYVDDTYLQGDTYDECLHNVTSTLNLLTSLGFTIHFDKSQLTPVQKN